MDRLTAADLSMALPEEFGWPQDIGALAILDGGGLVDANGRFRVEAVRLAIEARLHLVLRFRQLLFTPRRGLGGPLWVDAPAFDITDHVRVFPLAAPSDEAQLLLAVEQLRRRRLERARPLWEMWFLPGLPNGQVGLYIKVHHAVADGVAGVALLGAFLSREGEATPPATHPWRPAPIPSSQGLFADNLLRRARAVGRLFSALTRPADTMRRMRAGLPAVREVFAEKAPRTSLNRPIGADRTFALIRSRLEVTKRIAHAHGATVNDVLLAAIAGGLRELLAGRESTSTGSCCGPSFRSRCIAGNRVRPGATWTGRWSCRCRSAYRTPFGGWC